jgi:hypothetical protein
MNYSPRTLGAARTEQPVRVYNVNFGQVRHALRDDLKPVFIPFMLEKAVPVEQRPFLDPIFASAIRFLYPKYMTAEHVYALLGTGSDGGHEARFEIAHEHNRSAARRVIYSAMGETGVKVFDADVHAARRVAFNAELCLRTGDGPIAPFMFRRDNRGPYVQMADSAFGLCGVTQSPEAVRLIDERLRVAMANATFEMMKIAGDAVILNGLSPQKETDL